MKPRHPNTAPTNAIIDNQSRKVGGFLREQIDPGSRLSVVSAYFTIYAYGDLRARLDAIERMRFLYGEPRGVGAVDPSKAGEKAFRLTNDGGIELKQALAQKPLARACANWIQRKVDIRSVERSNFLHGKLYHVARGAGDNAAVLGSSNFTRGGLGLGVNPNIELNLELHREADREPLLAWFDALWNDHELTRDAKQEVLGALARLGRDYPPEFVYYKTLFHALGDRLAEHAEREGLIRDVHLYDTRVWKALFQFQRDGAVSAINRLMRHNGCIIADSVGLGKTWTALAVIKFFEDRSAKVLVLCPKKLEQNWIRYASWAGQAGNPLADDRLGYTVLAHTDLSRTRGESGHVNLANFNWSGFDLIVIDESHNFRNEGRDRKDEDGNLVARSRYNRLLEEVLKEGARTKVLMLSATPVNTSLRDLRNQIYLMTEKQQDAFRESLGIGDVQTVFRLAQREFQEWEKECARGSVRDKAALLERLGADFLALLDGVTIARSRSHVRRAYPEAEAEIGGFPENRVEARMALVDAAATGQDDLLAADDVEPSEALTTAAQYDLGFRDRQLRRMRGGSSRPGRGGRRDFDERLHPRRLPGRPARVLAGQSRGAGESAAGDRGGVADTTTHGRVSRRVLSDPTGRDLLPQAAKRRRGTHTESPPPVLPGLRARRRNGALLVPAGEASADAVQRCRAWPN